jgi:hypothetical protein
MDNDNDEDLSKVDPKVLSMAAALEAYYGSLSRRDDDVASMAAVDTLEAALEFVFRDGPVPPESNFVETMPIIAAYWGEAREWADTLYDHSPSLHLASLCVSALIAEIATACLPGSRHTAARVSGALMRGMAEARKVVQATPNPAFTVEQLFAASVGGIAIFRPVRTAPDVPSDGPASDAKAASKVAAISKDAAGVPNIAEFVAAHRPPPALSLFASIFESARRLIAGAKDSLPTRELFYGTEPPDEMIQFCK